MPSRPRPRRSARCGADAGSPPLRWRRGLALALAPAPPRRSRCSSSTRPRTPTTPPTWRRARSPTRRTYRVEQTRALMRPSASLSRQRRARVESNPTVGSNFSSNALRPDGQRPPAALQPRRTTRPSPRRSARSSRRCADLDTAEQDLMLRVSQAYFDVLGAQDTLQTTRANKAAIAEQLASAKRNFEVGTATITDTREAQARFDLATAQEIAADNDLRHQADRARPAGRPQQRRAAASSPCRSRCRRRRRPGRRPGSAARPRSIPRCAGPGSPSTSPQLETEKARAQAPADASMRWPRLQQRRAARSPPSVTGASTGGQHRRCSSTCRSSPACAIQNRIKETLVLEERSRNDLEAARRGVTQATRQAYYTLQSGAAQVKALEAAEASSQLALEATQLGYRVGMRVNIDVLNAQSQLYQTRRDLARARYDVLLGTLRLRQASGRLVPSRHPGDRCVAREVGAGCRARSCAPHSDRIAPSPLRSPPSEREGRAPLEPILVRAPEGSSSVRAACGCRERRGCALPCAPRRRDARRRTPARALRARGAASSLPTQRERRGARLRPCRRRAARRRRRAASSAASAKLKVCGPITTGQPQAAASIRFWPPSGAKLPPSRATSASA